MPYRLTFDYVSNYIKEQSYILLSTKIKSDMPYKAQYVLEELIKILEKSV